MQNNLIHQYSITLQVTYFIDAVSEREAIDIASLCALGMNSGVAMQGEIDLDTLTIELGYKKHSNNKENGE